MGTHYGTTTIRRQSNGIESTIIDYQQSSSGTTPPTGSWSTSPPTVSAGYYLWTRKTTKYTNGETDTEYSIGYKGSNGTAARMLQLTNDGDSVFVGTDKVLDVSEDYTLGTTELQFWVGATLTTSSITYGYEFSDPLMTDCVEVTIDSATRIATVKLKNGYNIENGHIKFYAVQSGKKYYASYHIDLIADGVDGTSYQLVMPFNAINLDKDGNYPSNVSSANATIVKNGGAIDASNYATEKLTWSLSVDGVAKYTDKTTSIPVKSAMTTYKPTKNMVYTLKYNGTIVDTETIPVVSDGIDGATISDTSVTYQAGSSGTTPPTGTWTSSIPAVSAGQYLWTKTTVTYSDGTETVSYSVGRNGTNGASATNTNPNLLEDTAFFLIANSATASKWEKNSLTKFADYEKEKFAYTDSTTSGVHLINQNLSIANAKIYTLSFEVRSTSSVLGNYYVRMNTTVGGTDATGGGIDNARAVVVDGATVSSPTSYQLINKDATAAWVKHTVRFQTKASFVMRQIITFSKSSNSNGTNVQFRHIKLEEGTVATPWCYAEADKKGEQGIPGMSGKTLRNRGKYNATTIGTTGDMLINVDGGFCDYITYVDGNNQGKFRLADGVTEWTKSYYIKNGTKTSSLVKPSFSGTNAVWTKFNEMKDLAVGMLIADSVNASNMNVVEAFFGDAGSGVTQNDDGTLTINSTANGWVIKGGEIRHTKTGFKLKSDGTLDSGVSGELTLRADSLKCLNNQNEKVMWLDDKGNLTTSGAVVNSIQEIDVANGKNTHLLIEVDRTNWSNMVFSKPLPVTTKCYMLDVLRCGSIIDVKNVDGHIFIPYYLGSPYYRRTTTLFDTGQPHLITETEMRRLIGKRIIVYGNVFTGTNYLYTGNSVTGASVSAANYIQGQLAISSVSTTELAYQINVANAFMLEMAVGYIGGDLVYYWKRVKFNSYDLDWEG